MENRKEKARKVLPTQNINDVAKKVYVTCTIWWGVNKLYIIDSARLNYILTSFSTESFFAER
jgi:hypothetical protein